MFIVKDYAALRHKINKVLDNMHDRYMILFYPHFYHLPNIKSLFNMPNSTDAGDTAHCHISSGSTLSMNVFLVEAFS